jgi:hypothetical protein
MIWGSPGIGKSEIVAQVAKDTERALIDIRATLLDPVDLRGIPSVTDSRAHWCPPAFLPTAETGPSILFIDEVVSAPPLVQAALYQLVIPPYRLGEYQLPDTCSVTMAGNRESDRAVVHRMPSPLANRLAHFDLEVHFDDWKIWAMKNNISPDLLGFLNYRKELLNDFRPERNEKAFPTPRAWAALDRLLKVTPAEHTMTAATALVGEGAAAQYSGFLRIRRGLQTPESITAAPDKAVVPTDPAILYAQCAALAYAAKEKNFDAITVYANRLPAEFSVLLAVASLSRCPEIRKTKGWKLWISTHTDVLI